MENFQNKELLHIKMEQHILVNSSKANSMDKELIPLWMVKNTLENGKII